jgi:hypothetical protein
MVAFRVAELTPTALAAGQVSSGGSQALANAASAAQGAADNFTAFYENEARINRELLLAQTQADWSRGFNERAKDAGPGFAEKIKGEYSAYIKDKMKAAPERGRENLELAFQKYGIDLETRALAAEAAARARAKAAAIAATRKARGEALRASANRLVSDPSMLDEMMQADPDNADYYVKLANDARMMSDPVAVRDEMQAGKWDAYLSPSEKMSFLKAGNAAAERQAREDEISMQVERKAYEKQLDEELAFTQANGAPPVDSVYEPAAIDAMYPPEEAAEIKRRYDNAVIDAEVLNGVSAASPMQLGEQYQSIIARVKEPGHTDEDVRRLQAFNAAVGQRDAALKADPSGYVLGVSDEASAVYEAWAAADDEDKPVAAQQLVDTIDANYDYLGVPSDLRPVLPVVARDQTVAQLNGLAPDVAAQSLTAYLGQWGDASGRVTAELTKGGLAPELAVAARYADNPGLAAAIVGLKGQDVATLKTGLLATDVTDAGRLMSETLTDFMQAFEAGDGTGQATKTFGTIAGVAEKLVLRNMRDGMDYATAVERVTEQMFPETPVNTAAMKLIVPKNLDADAIERAMETAMTEDAVRKFAPAAMNDPHLPEFADVEVMIAAAQDGVWLNNSTGDGAVLHLNIGGYYLPVVNGAGAMYELKFREALYRDMGPRP